MRVLVTQHADADTVAILRYLAANAGFAVAERYARDLGRLYDGLERRAPRPELGPATHICFIAPYLVMYDLRPEEIIILLRVLHTRCNITRGLVRLGPGQPSGAARSREDGPRTRVASRFASSGHQVNALPIAPHDPYYPTFNQGTVR